MGCRVGKSVGTWAENADQRPNIGPLTWCLLERMTRFELATLTLAKKKVVVTVRTVRLLRCSTPQSGKPSGKSVQSVQFVYRSTIRHARYVLSLPSG